MQGSAIRSAFVGMVVSACALAQPSISVIANSGSGVGAIAPGSLVTIYGTGLASSQDQAGGFPLPASLGGAAVSMNNLPCPLLYASASQINLQVPYEIVTGSAKMVVSVGSATTSATVIISAAAPGIFEQGGGRAAAQNADGSLNTASNPAAAGSVITVYFTGQGPVSPAGVTGGIGPQTGATATLAYSASIGGLDAPVQFLGLAPLESSGLAQANIMVPRVIPSGDFPLIITIGGVSSVSVILAVSGPLPSNPALTLLGSVRFSPSATQPLVGGLVNVAVVGNTAYVCGPSQIWIVDVSNSAAPKVTGSFGQQQLNGQGTNCGVFQNSAGQNYLIAVIQANGFVVFSVANPAQPRVVSGTVGLKFPFSAFMAFSGNTAFFTSNHLTYSVASSQVLSQGGEFQAYDLSNAANPGLLSTLAPATAIAGNDNLSPRFQTWIFSGQIAAILGTTSNGANPSGGVGQFGLVNVANPASMFTLGQVTIPPSVILTGIAVQNNLGLIAGNSKGWVNPGVKDPVTGGVAFPFSGTLTLNIVDFTTPTAPVLQSTTSTPIQTTTLTSVAPLAGAVYAITYGPPTTDLHGTSTLAVVDASNSQKVVTTIVASMQGDQANLAALGGNLYVATGAGLWVYQITLR
jgi:uncharacterized protein (TIGR03437 family)